MGRDLACAGNLRWHERQRRSVVDKKQWGEKKAYARGCRAPLSTLVSIGSFCGGFCLTFPIEKRARASLHAREKGGKGRGRLSTRVLRAAHQSIN